ncbi:high-affinity nickel-transporter protein [Rutstroemia sp. NJR-2017a BBW]|nr:high-affinity nickel-transporter protein [Rutstroemia sp. NJR-2017a BBW]
MSPRPPACLHPLIARLPAQVRLLPYPAVRIISLLVCINIAVWIAVAVVLRWHPALSSSAVLSYTFGLRHALDADHISAIDLMTRRLIAAPKANHTSHPVTVGTWFSLGHSTIVIITCIVVAATSGALESRFHSFQNIGGIIGTSISAAVLILLGIGNAFILWKLVRKMREVLREEVAEDEGIEGGLGFDGAGIMMRVLRRVFKVIDKPWKMYPLGVLFGLGFDTSSEIAVLGIASVQGAKGTSIWLILIFPLLFTAGMCMLDTTDGALMMTLYTSTSLARDTIAILYYSIVLTGITVLVAICIGVIQLLSLIANFATGSFWDGVNSASDHFDVIGGGICGAFVVGGGLSVLLYGPWRRWVEKGRPGNRSVDADEVELGELAVVRTDLEFEEEKGGGSRSLAREIEER